MASECGAKGTDGQKIDLANRGSSADQLLEVGARDARSTVRARRRWRGRQRGPRRCSHRGRCPPARCSRARRRRRIRRPRLRRRGRRSAGRRPSSAREDRSVWMPPSVFRVRMCSFTPISGPAAGSRMRCGAAHAADPVAEEAPRVADALHLGVLAERVGHLQIAGLDLGADAGRVEQRLVGERVHPRDEVLEVGRRPRSRRRVS